MAARKPQLGDAVIHHGRKHEITSFPREATIEGGKAKALEFVVFENAGYAVRADPAELVWSESDGAWCLPGRLLARDERVLYEAAIGAWPRAENHAIARDVMDSIDLAKLDRTRLTEVVMRQKHIRLEEEGIVVSTEDGGQIVNQKQLGAYVDRVVAHVEELRAARGGN